MGKTTESKSKNNNNYEVIRETIDKMVKAKNELYELEVIRSERLTGEIGEWFIKTLFGGNCAETTSQKGWDIIIDGKKVQVKAHAKGDKTTARWTPWKYEKKSFDEIIIIVFTKEFRLKELYRIPYNEAKNRVDSKQRILRWNDCVKYKIELDTIKNKKLINAFKLI